MIRVENIIVLLKEKFKDFEVIIDEFKPNEAVHIYIKYYKDSRFELCFEITKKWIGFSKLDKSLEINFSSNDEVFTVEEDFICFLEDYF